MGEIMAGRNPRIAPTAPDTTSVLTVAEFLDRYQTTYVEAEGLKSADTVLGHMKALKASLGSLLVTALEKPADISRFKAEYRQGRKLATVNRALGVLRAAINWGWFQDPPLLDNALPSFRRDDQSTGRNERDRRIHRDEEHRLLAACVTMNAAEHECAGPRCTIASSAPSKRAVGRARCPRIQNRTSSGRSIRS